MPTSLKVEKFPLTARLAPERIERHETEQALLSAAFVRDAHMRDLENEFAQRAAKIRQQYLDDVAEVMTP